MGTSLLFGPKELSQNKLTKHCVNSECKKMDKVQAPGNPKSVTSAFIIML